MIAMASFDFLRSSDNEQGPGDQRQICLGFPKIDPVSQATRRHTEDRTNSFQHGAWMSGLLLSSRLYHSIAPFLYSGLLILSQKWWVVSFRCVSCPSMRPHLWCFCILGLILLVIFRQDGTSHIGQRPSQRHRLEQRFHSSASRAPVLDLSRFLRFIRGRLSNMSSWMSSNFVISCKDIMESCNHVCFGTVLGRPYFFSAMPCRHSSPPLSPGSQVPWGTNATSGKLINLCIALPCFTHLKRFRNIFECWIVFWDPFSVLQMGFAELKRCHV